jgi:hypothetical protein
VRCGHPVYAADSVKRWVGISRPAGDQLAKGGSVRRSRTINRTQGLVLGFFVVAWIALVVMLAASADLRDVTITVLAIGVLQRRSWIFWLILVAFAAGLVRVPVAVLQLSGRMVPEGPDWYIIVQGVVGVIQVAVAVAMFAGYRRSGPWGPF